MWISIVAVLAIAIVGFLFYVNGRPDSCNFQRSVHVNAPAEKVFPLINDIRASVKWNPFVKKDPNIKSTYSGPESGPSAKYAFEGNNQVGTGSCEIVESKPNEYVNMRLLMIKPFAGENKVVFTLKPQGGGTFVTWAMEGKVPFIAKIMHTIMNMDKMIGGEFDAGLAEMKAMAEAA